MLAFAPDVAIAQSATYHLHKETSKTGGGVLQLKTAAPDVGSAAFSVDLKNRPAGDYLIKTFDTAAGIPNTAGVVPAGSTVSALLWMRKTANAGVMYPRMRLTLNTASGASVCAGTGTTPLTTTMTSFTVTCTTPAQVVMAAADRLFLWTGVTVTGAPGNTGVKAELRIEGTVNGNHDSRITVPTPGAVPSINSLSPASGPVGAIVSIGGSSFGAVQGASIVRFNGTAAVPTAWSASSITAPVPADATTGPVVVTVGGLSSNGASFTVTIPPTIVSGPVSFGYDALGRLIQVTAASGQSAIYRYDAVGNMLAIERPGSPDGGSPVAISGFTPGQGAPGTSVTITGAGFSTAIAENGVAFNGVAASITAASQTEIVAVVPAGATTGPIGVQSPAGSATNGSPFVVLTSDAGAPTILSLSPSIGVTGTPFTINGTNFETVPANNRVTLNIRPADVTVASATSISTSVPLAAMGGRVTVATPAGIGVSGPDFVVVPSPYTPADVESSQRIAPGETRTLAVSSAGRIALLLFDGVAGQFVSILSTSSTWTSCQFGGQYTFTLYRPDASIQAGVSNACGTSTLMDHKMLPQTGTYTIVLDPIGSNVGSTSMSLYAGIDVTGTIAADGTAVPVSTATPTQNARLTFEGTAGQIVTGTVYDATFPGSCLSYAFALTLVKPDGSTLASSPSCGGSVFMDQRTLPVSGTYTLLLDPGWTGTGAATVRLYTVSDVVGPISADGTSVAVSLTTPGQNARLTFTGTAGQIVSGLVTNATIPGNCNAYAFYLTVLRPDGSTLKSVPSCGGGVFLDRHPLPVSGVYTLLLDAGWASTGNATVTLYTVIDLVNPAAHATPVPVTISTPGQNALLTFTGAPGQVVTGLVSNATIPGNCVSYAFYLTLQRPDGSTQQSVPSCGGGVFLDRQTLSMSGTYTLLLDPNGAGVGAATVTLYTVLDVNGTIQPNGPSVPVTITTPGQNARLTFTATAGQVVTASTFGNTIPGNCFSYAYYLSIVKPDGSTLVSGPSCGGSLSLGQRTLPSAGTYTIVLDPTDSRTGSISIALTSP